MNKLVHDMSQNSKMFNSNSTKDSQRTSFKKRIISRNINRIAKESSDDIQLMIGAAISFQERFPDINGVDDGLAKFTGWASTELTMAWIFVAIISNSSESYTIEDFSQIEIPTPSGRQKLVLLNLHVLLILSTMIAVKSNLCETFSIESVNMEENGMKDDNFKTKSSETFATLNAIIDSVLFVATTPNLNNTQKIKLLGFCILSDLLVTKRKARIDNGAMKSTVVLIMCFVISGYVNEINIDVLCILFGIKDSDKHKLISRLELVYQFDKRKQGRLYSSGIFSPTIDNQGLLDVSHFLNKYQIGNVGMATVLKFCDIKLTDQGLKELEQEKKREKERQRERQRQKQKQKGTVGLNDRMNSNTKWDSNKAFVVLKNVQNGVDGHRSLMSRKRISHRLTHLSNQSHNHQPTVRNNNQRNVNKNKNSRDKRNKNNINNISQAANVNVNVNKNISKKVKERSGANKSGNTSVGQQGQQGQQAQQGQNASHNQQRHVRPQLQQQQHQGAHLHQSHLPPPQHHLQQLAGPQNQGQHRPHQQQHYNNGARDDGGRVSQNRQQHDNGYSHSNTTNSHLNMQNANNRFASVNGNATNVNANVNRNIRSVRQQGPERQAQPAQQRQNSSHYQQRYVRPEQQQHQADQGEHQHQHQKQHCQQHAGHQYQGQHQAHQQQHQSDGYGGDHARQNHQHQYQHHNGYSHGNTGNSSWLMKGDNNQFANVNDNDDNSGNGNNGNNVNNGNNGNNGNNSNDNNDNNGCSAAWRDLMLF